MPPTHRKWSWESLKGVHPSRGGRHSGFSMFCAQYMIPLGSLGCISRSRHSGGSCSSRGHCLGPPKPGTKPAQGSLPALGGARDHEGLLQGGWGEASWAGRWPGPNEVCRSASCQQWMPCGLKKARLAKGLAGGFQGPFLSPGVAVQ